MIAWAGCTTESDAPDWTTTPRALSVSSPDSDVDADSQADTTLPTPASAAHCIASLKQKRAAGPLDDSDRSELASCYRQLRVEAAKAEGKAAPERSVDRWLARTNAVVGKAHLAWSSGKGDLPAPTTAGADDEKVELAALKAKGLLLRPSAGSASSSLAAQDVAVEAGPLEPKGPSASQAGALRAWAGERHDAVEFTWSAQRKGLTSAHGDLTASLPKSDIGVRDILAAEVLERLEAICPSPAGWVWQLESEAPLPREDSWQLVFRRHGPIDGMLVPVLGSTVEVSIGPDPRDPERLHAFALGTSCRGDLPATAALSAPFGDVAAEQVATSAAKEATGSTTGPATAENPAPPFKLKGGLRIAMVQGKPRAVWALRVTGDKGEQRIWVDAANGALLGNEPTEAHLSSGTLSAQVRRPYQVGLATGRVSKVDILSQNVSSLHGLYWVGASNELGDYTSESSVFGTARYPRICGSWHCAEQSNAYLAPFSVGDSPTYAVVGGDPNNWTQRRLETLVALNHVRRVAKMAFAGLPVVSWLTFDIPSTGNTAACNGVCCTDDTLSVDGFCVGAGGGGQAAERALRFFVYHEWGHSPLYAALGNSNPPNPTTTLLRAWWESTADALAYAVTGIELLRGGPGVQGVGCGDPGFLNVADAFFPDDRFGQDECLTGPNADVHDHGNILAAIDLDLLYQLGWKDTLYRVFESVDEVGSSTTTGRVIGSDSFYAEMIESDSEAWIRRPWEMIITRAWYRHDDPFSSGLWTWTDQWPGARNPAWLHPLPTPVDASQWQDTGKGHSYLPDSALEHVHDHDYLWVYLRAGVETRFRAWSPTAVGTDTVLRIVQMAGNVETTIASNDDFSSAVTGAGQPCVNDMPVDGQGSPLASGLSSCLRFTPAVSGYYGIVVSGFDESVTGPYTWEYRVLDDAGGGDSIIEPEATEAAYSISTGGDTYDMGWQFVGDNDWFRIHIPADYNNGGPTPVSLVGATLNVEVCTDATAGSADSAVFLLRDPSNLQFMDWQTNNATTCLGGDAGTRVSAVIPAGGVDQNWFAWVYEPGLDATGRYTIRAFITAGPNPDDYWDPNLILAGAALTSPAMDSAQPIDNGASTGRFVSGHFHAGDPGDTFRVDLVEGEHVTFSTQDLRGGADTVLELYADTSTIAGYQQVPDSTRRWLQSDDDDGLELFSSRIHFVAPRAGRYYIRVRPFNASTVGSWTLHVQRMGNSHAALPALP